MTQDSKAFPRIDNISRRGFVVGAAAGALVLAAGYPARLARTQEKPKYAGEGMPFGLRDDPKIFLILGEDGIVTFICHRADMGQGVRTGLALIVADELEADWAKIKVRQAEGDEARYGNQDTDGSRTTRHHFMTMRRVGAAARAMLETAAAAQWGVPVAEVKAVNHEIVHEKSGKTLGYGALAKAASALPSPASAGVKLKTPAEFRYIGKGKTDLVDGFDITTGRAQYGIDTRLDGMLYAVVARTPVYGGTVKTFDAAETLKVPGVVKVVSIEGAPVPSEFMPVAGIAVVAKNTWAAIKGREALKIEWAAGPNGSYSSDSYRKTLEDAARKPGKVVRTQGDVDQALKSAAKRVEAEYYVPHLAQAPMEPPAAVVQIKDGKCEAWSCVQSPQAARDRLAKRLGLAPENVKVNVTLLGGGFGRKSKPDYVVEAGLVSQAMDGVPIKLTWTREDDLRQGYLHTVSLERIEGGLDAGGRTSAWLHRSAAPTIGSIFGPGMTHELPFELGMGLVNTPFDVLDARFENPAAEAHARIGWFRSVSNIPHAFAAQSFAAELAAAAGRDPKEFLLELIGPARKIDPHAIGDSWNHGEDPALYPIDTGRLRGVIEKAAAEIGWGRTLPRGRGLGIAGHYSFVTYVAVAVEVEVGTDGTLSVPRVDLAVDCGPQVNPDRIRAQMEGAVLMGHALTTLSAITFKDGAVEQSNFDGYEVTRIDAAPTDIRIHLVGGQDWNQPLGGVGEPGVPPVAPAICNAIFAATGKRIRSLPIANQLRA